MKVYVLVTVTLLVGDFASPQALPPRQGRVTRERKRKSKNEKLKNLKTFFGFFFPKYGFFYARRFFSRRIFYFFNITHVHGRRPFSFEPQGCRVDRQPSRHRYSSKVMGIPILVGCSCWFRAGSRTCARRVVGGLHGDIDQSPPALREHGFFVQ